MKSAKIVIVGAGQAGARAALALRELGHVGSITLVGDELEPPYERPPLSKGMLGANVDAIRVHLHEPGHYSQSNIDLLSGRSVVVLNRNACKVELCDGSLLSYDRCLLATGGRARIWQGVLEGNGNRIVTLRNLQDARRLHKQLQSVRHLVVMGGGFLGLECADAASALGVSTTVVEAGQRLLPEKMPPALSQILLARHKANGVQFRLGANVTRIIDCPEKSLIVELGDAERLCADLCLVAIGQVPNIELAVDAGLETGNGIHVDRQCRTSDPSIFAAGDCASFPFGPEGTRVRIESWHNAEQQSRIAAACVLGAQANYAPLPWFWTDQSGWNIQFLGLPKRNQALEWVMRQGKTPDSGVWMGMQDGKIMAAVAVNSGVDMAPLRTLIAKGIRVDPSMLADPAMKLTKLAKTSAMLETVEGAAL